jgi:exopolysaccharide biosynthesis polyprenyl glycosylphosphotransferase
MGAGTLSEASTHAVAASDDLVALLDERTRRLLDERGRARVVRRRGWLLRRMLLAADVSGLVLAFLTAQLVLGGTGREGDHVAPVGELLLFLATLPGWVIVAKVYRLYDRDAERTDHTTADDLVGVFHLVTIGCWLSFAFGWLTELARPSVSKVFGFWAIAILLVTIARATVRSLCRRRDAYLQNTVIVGAGDVGQMIARKLLQHPEYGINLIGFVDAAPKARRDDLDQLTVLGKPHDLPTIVEAFDVERLIVAFSGDRHEDTLELLRTLKDQWVQIDIVPRLYEIVGPGAGMHTVEGLPLLSLPPFRLSRSSRLLKRSMDAVLSLLALGLLLPLFVAVSVLIKLDSPGTVFFRQIRMGAGNRTFRVWKFRTMIVDADERKAAYAHLNQHARPGGDARMFKIVDDPRVTRVGRVLRRFSLDELPQLVNVLRGEMSLVGPRPLILSEDRQVYEWARKRLDLKPGITGLWQVLGRSAIPFEEMIKLDYLYVTNWSIGNDVLLLFRTIPAVVRGNRW